jgi:asparagine synthase (glutamine-hydrolysing)
MCGICGWAGSPPDRARLSAALHAMEHRGPDQDGQWCAPAVMLGHRRLSIIDLSADGRQPMANEDETVQVVLNGEIYNHRELRRALEGRHRFRSRSDTEVLVHGYEEWGIEGLLSRISGMFALGVWDTRAGVLHLARDRVGKKPLFYAQEGPALAFASTLPSLLALLPREREVRPEAVHDFLHYLCLPGGEAMHEGVRKLPPGHRLELRDGRAEVHPYWRVSFAHQERRSADEWLEEIDGELRRSVERRLESDVPLGVFLSGGVDSSLVAAVASKLAGGGLKTISAGFEEERFSELPYARQVARHLGTDHRELIVRPDDGAILPWMIFAAGEPFGDHAALPTLYLSRAAREHVTVVLTGDGGDECFAGYPGPMLARMAGPYRRLVPRAARAAAPAILQRVEARGGGVGTVARRLRRLATAARGGFDWVYDPLGERGFRGRFDGLFTPAFSARLGGRDPDVHWRAAWADADGPTDADRVLETELRTLLPDQFLVKTDIATMAYGIEARSPFLDTAMIELSARIPVSMKVARMEPKHLLKRLAARYVPPEVVYRRKQGFSVPTGAWMRGDLGAAAQDVLLGEAALSRGIFEPAAVRRLLDDHRSGRAEHGQRIWLLFMLELWMRMFVDRTLSPDERLEVGRPARAAA